ncbi:MAG: hypothetical protein N2043_02295 [Ignavibacterium sp.]|nr:hypothetical protein [Ignavibacterium sp.]
MSKPRLIQLAPGKVAFYCEETRIHLSLSNPVVDLGDLPASKAIIRGIKGKALIDVNNNILNQNEDLSTKEVTEKEEIQEPQEQQEEQMEEEQQEDKRQRTRRKKSE